MTGKKLHIPKCNIGQYVHGHLPTTNDTDIPRTTEGLYLGTNDNGTGHYIFKLETKKKISVPRVTVAPLPDSVINHVNEMAEKEGAVKREDGVLTFGNFRRGE